MIRKSLFITLLLPVSMQETSWTATTIVFRRIMSILLLVPIVITHTVPFILICIRIALVVLPLPTKNEGESFFL